MDTPLYVQFGCAHEGPAAWRNFDVSPTLRLQRLPAGQLLRRWLGLPAFAPNIEYGDIVKGLPIGNAVCDAMYCAHVLEHLALQDFRAALRNVYRHLRPGGVFRLAVPDLSAAIRDYVASDAPDKAIVFCASGTLLGTETRPRTVGQRLRAMFGSSRHLWMWDYPAIALELKRAGFSDIRRATYGDSTWPGFGDVEAEDRWNPTCCVGVECHRPITRVSEWSRTRRSSRPSYSRS